jgi:hypothetical protein
MIFLKNKWGELFKKNITTYAKGRPKRGVFIDKYLSSEPSLPDNLSCLEQGAFSAKDSLYLNSVFPNWICTATDTDINVVKHIREVGLEGKQEDAFELSFENNKFEITFQSGLIILFSDQQALEIIKEQLRVTSKISFIFAHNKHNYIDRVISFFKRKIMKKHIFSYRCYSESTLREIALSLGCKHEIFHYDNMIVNFSVRHCLWLKPIIQTLGIDKYRYLANELVLVLHK